MCRHLAWLGAPRSLAALMLDPASGLLVQSYAPRRQKHGLINADGWGAGLFDGDQVRRWRSAAPLWGDASFASMAPMLRSHCVVAAVRSASAGMPIEATACAPFTDGRTLLSHNGLVDRDALARCGAGQALAGAQPESVVDSALLAALVFGHGLDRLGELVAMVGAADPNARLNVVAANGSELFATVWGDTLSVLDTGDGVVLASEPYDEDPGWRELPDRHLVRVGGAGIRVTALKGRP